MASRFGEQDQEISDSGAAPLAPLTINLTGEPAPPVMPAQSALSRFGDAPAPPEATEEERRTVLGFLGNLPKSYGNLLYSMVNVPQQVQGVTALFAGMAEKSGFKKLPGLGDTNAVDALIAHYTDRYGSFEGFKKAVYEDPAGVMFDVATVLEPGAVGLKAVGLPRAAAATTRVARAINPVAQTIRAGSAVARTAAPALETAATAARAGIPAALPDVARGTAKVGAAYALEHVMPGGGVVKYAFELPSAYAGAKQIGRGVKKGVAAGRQALKDRAAAAAEALRAETAAGAAAVAVETPPVIPPEPAAGPPPIVPPEPVIPPPPGAPPAGPLKPTPVPQALAEFEAAKNAPDPLYADAVRLVSGLDEVSTATLQRQLRMGYGRASAVLDALEREGIVGPAAGGKPRQVMKGPEAPPGAPPATAPEPDITPQQAPGRNITPQDAARELQAAMQESGTIERGAPPPEPAAGPQLPDVAAERNSTRIAQMLYNEGIKASDALLLDPSDWENVLRGAGITEPPPSLTKDVTQRLTAIEGDAWRQAHPGSFEKWVPGASKQTAAPPPAPSAPPPAEPQTVAQAQAEFKADKKAAAAEPERNVWAESHPTLAGPELPIQELARRRDVAAKDFGKGWNDLVETEKRSIDAILERQAAFEKAKRNLPPKAAASAEAGQALRAEMGLAEGELRTPPAEAKRAATASEARVAKLSKSLAESELAMSEIEKMETTPQGRMILENYAVGKGEKRPARGEPAQIVAKVRELREGAAPSAVPVPKGPPEATKTPTAQQTIEKVTSGDYREQMLDLGMRIRNKQPVTEAEISALNPDDAAAMRRLQHEYRPLPETPVEPPKIIRAGESGFEHVEGHFDQLTPNDEYLYHITTKPNAAQILTEGLKPGTRPAMAAGFYRDYSQGKTFLTDAAGVSYWKERIASHIEYETGRTPKLTIIRIPKKHAGALSADTLGTRDARAPSYFAEAPIREPLKPTTVAEEQAKFKAAKAAKPTKEPSAMSASEINKRLDRLDKKDSQLTERLIAEGRGHERMSEIAKQTDPLSLEVNAVRDEIADLRRQIERRYGPGAPSRLPRGFGPIK